MTKILFTSILFTVFLLSQTVNAENAKAVYGCSDNKTIHAYFYDSSPQDQRPEGPPIPTGSVRLSLSDGRELNLRQTISASGIRYANPDESIVFWSKGNTAFMEEDGVEIYQNCVVSAK